MSLSTFDIVMIILCIKVLGMVVFAIVELICNTQSPLGIVALCCAIASCLDGMHLSHLQELKEEITRRRTDIENQNPTDEFDLTVILYKKLESQYWMIYGLYHIIIGLLALLMIFYGVTDTTESMICFGVSYGFTLGYIVYRLVVRE